LCSRLNLWQPEQLLEFHTLVDGLRPYQVDPRTDYGTVGVIAKAAAARPGVYRVLNSASKAAMASFKRGELWWVDFSPQYSADPEGTRRVIYAFEHHAGFPFYRLRP